MSDVINRDNVVLEDKIDWDSISKWPVGLHSTLHTMGVAYTTHDDLDQIIM